MKTTNAKARGLQTPAAPGTMKPERTTKRASTQKVKKFTPLTEPSQPEVQAQPAPDDVPDIEYMPPKPKGGLLTRLLPFDLPVLTFLQNF